MEIFKSFTLHLRGRLHRFCRPQVMGILNATPDSFYGASRYNNADAVRAATDKMIGQGADIIDVGAYSTRPGAGNISVDEELRRLDLALECVRKVNSDIPVSIDTFRAEVARKAVREMGADIVNDVSGGDLDSAMFDTIAELNVPYVLMHMRGTPDTMLQQTDYSDVSSQVLSNLQEKVVRLSNMGVADIIVDPGFGFAKNLEQNYELLRNLHLFNILDRPLLVGMSRKSMIFRAIDKTPEDALEGTVAANTIAVLNGASVLRVHDVGAATDAINIIEHTYPSFISCK
ncbi:dihydropteroate synthase [uncultured Muribaculum sp.]|uniref:dihydropteroate synthase n=3 Tax=uncultured Muribaculum sp. TaxID=1918613 RepID=UPI0025AF78A1|nr:dihydropteroate synthase [uncultured Muribaculum sp.]